MKARDLRRIVGVFSGMTAVLSLAFLATGCGGGGQESGDAVVVTEPGANVGTTATPAPSATAPAATAPAATAPASTALVKSEGWGNLKGQVVFSSNAPEVKILQPQGKAEKDPNVCAKDAPIKSERLVVDAASKGVKNVFVFIPKPTAVSPDAKTAAGKAEILFDQKGCVFEPHAIGVMEGAKITIKSSDSVQHNVNVKFQKNTPFNQVLAPTSTTMYTPSIGERQPTLVACDIHPWMQAYWMVLDNPYIAVTDDKGNFEIKNVPAGTQKVVVWQEATGFVTAPTGEEVNVTAGAEATAKSFTVDAGKVKPAN